VTFQAVCLSLLGAAVLYLAFIWRFRPEQADRLVKRTIRVWAKIKDHRWGQAVVAGAERRWGGVVPRLVAGCANPKLNPHTFLRLQEGRLGTSAPHSASVIFLDGCLQGLPKLTPVLFFTPLLSPPVPGSFCPRLASWCRSPRSWRLFPRPPRHTYPQHSADSFR
jgi:hypothetical protein